MNSRFLHIILCAVGIVLASCSSDGTDIIGQPSADSTAITFDATTVPITRAKGDYNSAEDLQGDPLQSGIGIFASYTGPRRYASSTVRPNFMCNQRATWDDGASYWTYSPLKYWPNGQGEATDQGQGEITHKVSFFAYAPWSDLVTTSTTQNQPANCITRCSETYDEGDPWLYYRIAGKEIDPIPDDGIDERDPTSQQVDLLYAVCDYDYYGTDEGMCNIDLTKPDVNKRVKFIFHHALGCVGDRVTITASSDLQDTMEKYVKDRLYDKVELVILGVDIDYTLTAGAKLILWNRKDAPNWQADTENNVKTTRHVTLMKEVIESTEGQGSYAVKQSTGDPEVIRESWVDTGNGVFYIPVEGDDYVQSATINVSYCMRYYFGETPIDMPAEHGSATIYMRDKIPTSEAHGRNLWINVLINAEGQVMASFELMAHTAFTPWTDADTGSHEVYNW